MKFTFKRKARPTGLASVAYRDSWEIKLNKKQVGAIHTKKGWKNFEIGIMIYKEVPDDNLNCDWKWIFFKKEFSTIDEAKEWINKPEIIKQITEKYKLRYK